jgi:hypothetical protein
MTRLRKRYRYLLGLATLVAFALASGAGYKWNAIPIFDAAVVFLPKLRLG